MEIPCSVTYNPAIKGKKEKKVLLPKKIETLKGNNWEPYPAVTWIDGVEYEDQLVTRVLFVMPETGDLIFAESPEGVPDAKLMMEAEKAGILTETR